MADGWKQKQNNQHQDGKQSQSEGRFDADLADIEADVDAWIEQSDSNM